MVSKPAALNTPARIRHPHTNQRHLTCRLLSGETPSVSGAGENGFSNNQSGKSLVNEKYMGTTPTIPPYCLSPGTETEMKV